MKKLSQRIDYASRIRPFVDLVDLQSAHVHVRMGTWTCLTQRQEKRSAPSGGLHPTERYSIMNVKDRSVIF
jgi:hypothetical protein